ncbi:hypothetical protein GCM10027612_82600 [Microbispora bryophytorum subsp. camponoti]
MRGDACSSGVLRAGSCESFGHHEIDRNALRVQPCTRLSIDGVTVEPRPAHGLLQKRLVLQHPRIECEIAVFRRLGQRDGTPRGAQIDGLRADHDNGVAMCIEGGQSIKKRGARSNEKVASIYARRIHYAPSIR